MQLRDIFRRKIPDNYVAEDYARRSLANGECAPEAVEILLNLARRRKKPGDLIHIHRQLQDSERTAQFDRRELDWALRAQRQRLARFREKDGGPLRIAVHFHEDWLRRLSEGIVERAAAYGTVFETGSEREIVKIKPDAVLSTLLSRRSVTKLRKKLPDTFWVYLRHGFANKRSSFPLAGGFDAVCVSSPTVANYYTGTGFFPPGDVWITGYPPLDRLAQIEPDARTGPPTILYAPTHDKGLTSATTFGPAILQPILKTVPDVRVIVKLHPLLAHTEPLLWRDWQDACDLSDRCRFIDDPAVNLLEFFPETSVLISDFSSAAFSFLATGRPILLLTPPDPAASRGVYDPTGIEWTWRDMGEEVRDIALIEPVLRELLTGDDRRAEIRKRYQKLLFGDTLDGNAAERVMQRLGQVFGRSFD